MMQKAAWMHDHADDRVAAGEAANMAKFAAAEAGAHCLDAAIQTHGGNGMATEYGLADLWGLVRLLRIAPVSREMILNFVAQQSLGLPSPTDTFWRPTAMVARAPKRPRLTGCSASAQRFVGHRVARVEDPRLLTGRGSYVDDVTVPGHAARALRAQPLRPCPHPWHRRGGGASPSRVVVAVYTGADIAALTHPFMGFLPLPDLYHPMFFALCHRLGARRR